MPFVVLNTIKKIKLDSREKDLNPKKNFKIKSWKRREVIKDYRFYIVSLNMLAMPWIATGVFVYQSFISDSKMWDIYTIPKAVENTIKAVVKAFIEPINFTPYISAQVDDPSTLANPFEIPTKPKKINAEISC